MQTGIRGAETPPRVILHYEHSWRGKSGQRSLRAVVGRTAQTAHRQRVQRYERHAFSVKLRNAFSDASPARPMRLIDVSDNDIAAHRLRHPSGDDGGGK